MDQILVLNAGSSNTKFALYGLDTEGRVIDPRRGLVEQCDGQLHLQVEGAAAAAPADMGAPGRSTDDAQLRYLFTWMASLSPAPRLVAVGHRVVHGGEIFSVPLVMDANNEARLQALMPLAPLHQGRGLAGIAAARAFAPAVPQVACFDTAFHRTLPRVSRNYALPRELTQGGIRRYGFHGLSYESIAEQLRRLLPAQRRERVVVAHLGNGASLCALRDLASVATTMGFSALDGLVMGTRCGSIDPGVLLYLLREKGYDVHQLTRLLYHDSGLLGVSGLSHDLRDLLAIDHPHAAEAVDLYVERIVRELGAMAAALDGLDALVFTGGVGENAAVIRQRVCERGRWMGLDIDPCVNQRGGTRLTTAASPVSGWKLHTDEEGVIANHVARLLTTTRDRRNASSTPTRYDRNPLDKESHS